MSLTARQEVRGKPRGLPHSMICYPPGAVMTEISMPPNPSLWRRVTAAYAKLLEILLAACVGILVIPVTLQIISRYTPFIPSYIWTEEMARFLFVWTIMIGAMVGVQGGAAFRSRRLARPVAARLRPRCGFCARLGVLAMALVFVWAGHRIHAVRLEPDVGTGRSAALADPCRLAGGRRDMDRVCGRTDRR